jgi:hypothetical protein
VRSGGKNKKRLKKLLKYRTIFAQIRKCLLIILGVYIIINTHQVVRNGAYVVKCVGK